MADTLATGYEQKRVKYTALANAMEFRRSHLNLSAVTILSMGAADPMSLNEFRIVMGRINREPQKRSRQMPDAAITRSLKIGRQFTQIWNEDQRLTGKMQ
jgi:hypothetical protein